MTAEMWLVLGILTAALVLFTTEWLRLDIVAWGVVVSLILTGLLTTQEALSGFSNPAVIIIAALFVVGGGVLQTGLAAAISRRILTIAGDSETRLLVVLMLAVAVLSSFMSDTGTVAVLLPAIIIITRSSNISPGKLMIPLSYGALLGGASTLIGTPPNLIVNELLLESGLEPFNFFSFTPLGIILIITGTLFMVLVGRHLLPDRKPKHTTQDLENPQELIEQYHLQEAMFRLRIRRGSSLLGKSISESRLGKDYHITILDIQRCTRPYTRIPFLDRYQPDHDVSRTSVQPESDSILENDDLLIVQGQRADMLKAAARWNLGFQEPADSDQDLLLSDEVGIAEIILRPRSNLIGKTLVQARFSSHYGLIVLGIQRPGQAGALDPKATTLRFGDVMLVQGEWKQIAAMKKERRDFIVVGEPETMVMAPHTEKAPIALVILLVMLFLMISNVIPVAAASMIAALLMVLSGCLNMDEAYRVIDWKSILLVAGMLPLSLALEKAGIVSLAAENFSQSIGPLGPIYIMGGLFLLTSLFTQILSNTATTVLVAPIALATAEALQVEPHGMLMAVAVAASMAFASPVASPVNTLVMGAGNYRFSDYVKVGLPMILLTFLAVILLLPLLFPF